MPALLFDLDGTLIDSDRIHAEVFVDLFGARGLPMDHAFYLANVHGRLNEDVFAEFLPGEPDPAALSRAKEAEFRRRLPRPSPAMPGAMPLIESARAKGWRLAVVTNAERPNAEAMLAAIGLSGTFDAVVIGEECARAKPYPDPYLAALRQVGVAAEAAVVFEDSPSGIRAAVAAGIRTIGLRSSLDDAALRAAGAEASIADFTDPTLTPLLTTLEGAAP